MLHVIFGSEVTFHFQIFFMQVIKKNVVSHMKGIPCHFPNWKFCVIQSEKVTLEFFFQLLEMKFNLQLKLTFRILYFFPAELRQSLKMRLYFPLNSALPQPQFSYISTYCIVIIHVVSIAVLQKQI